MTPLADRLGLTLPIIQAPMAGTSTPAMAAAVSNAGGLGSMGLGAVDAEAARSMIAAARGATNRAFNVNLFCHRPAVRDAAREAGWIDRLRPHFAAYGAEPPATLAEIYRSFVDDDAMLAMLLDTRPAIVSFHFGLPGADRIAALRDAGIILFASATSLAEGRAIAAAGIDAVVAQGYEAGGHRGIFDPDGPDERLGTMALTRLLVRSLDRPVIAAGGIMDGAGIAAALTLGAEAAQLGTAFVGCPESAADQGYRAALATAERTVMTRAISGRLARSIVNRFTAIDPDPAEVAPYPVAYDAGKALNAAAKAKGEAGYGAQWAGQAAPLARSMPAAELVELLGEEMRAALAAG
ncbi:2-nitropropane dioxygenase, NPD [Rhizorhabdus wittichii RW1]|uniref:Nitronate monooxygenase n=1 Tax=Rhizorhabdus wittichii (strain DSM 6014 / CCUG 31198 / JCM 15750 / NBRC 105917 / EY 4224 / RW1) TaxID=392499 RepID=A0A9J9LEP4_RHIWR|nr:2-nitropropane dioxygenase, NPD [Rhizorhabdus wittichii RW1]